MADEKLNPGQGEQIKLDISGAPPAPDLAGVGPPEPEPGSPAELGPGDVVVDVGKIDELTCQHILHACVRCGEGKNSKYLGTADRKFGCTMRTVSSKATGNRLLQSR